MSETSVVWFRRDLRVHDQPTFLAAAEHGGPAQALFVLDPALLDPAGPARRTFLYRSLRDLDASLGGKLLVVRGDPADVVPRIAAAVEAGAVHLAADFGPYGVPGATTLWPRPWPRTGGSWCAPGRRTR